MNAIGARLYGQQFGAAKPLTAARITAIIAESTRSSPPTKFSASFLASEWWEIVDAWQLDSWEAYRDVKRLGRKTRLSERVRQSLWDIFTQVNQRVAAGGWTSDARMFTRLAEQDRKSVV